MSVPVAVLISGRGSNMQALIEACIQTDFPAHIALVISNTPEAGGLDIARQNNIETKIIEHTVYSSRAGFENTLSDTLHSFGIKLVCLAGFMRLLGPAFVHAWQGRLINIHPSILPAFKGLDTHARALESGVKMHGCTVHFVSDSMDEGAIIGQAEVPVLKGDTQTTLAKRVLDAEHRLYPVCLAALARRDIRLEEGKIICSSNPDDTHGDVITFSLLTPIND